MSANGLARLYGRLTIWERIPLLMAAEARGDTAEYRRLFDASAPRTWLAPEHLLAEEALHVLALTYVGEQLDAAASYFFALWAVADADEPVPGDWHLAADNCAYFFAANLDAWRRLCSELGIAPDVLTAGNHRGWFLHYREGHMPANAPTKAALQARFRENGQEAPQLATADSLLASWRDLLQAMTRHAPLNAGKGET
jgi:hypothetical protein